MREIRFRGQDFETGEWIYGSYNGVNAGAADVFIIYEKEIFDPESLGFIDTEIVEKGVKEETVGQYTGLKDKNGVEIYEGDILAYETSRSTTKGVVEYGSGLYGWVHAGIWFHMWDIHLDSAEVIGNIYENPELLNGNKE